MNGQAMPLCSICWETLGKYGGPVTLPCGELHCSASQHCMLPASLSLTAGNILNLSLSHLGAQHLLTSCSDLLQLLLTVHHRFWHVVRRPQRLPPLHGAAAARQAGVPSLPSSLPCRCVAAALISSCWNDFAWHSTSASSC